MIYYAPRTIGGKLSVEEIGIKTPEAEALGTGEESPSYKVIKAGEDKAHHRELGHHRMVKDLRYLHQ